MPLRRLLLTSPPAPDYTDYRFPPGFKPIGFNTSGFGTTLSSSGTDDENFGISGQGGQVFAFL